MEEILNNTPLLAGYRLTRFLGRGGFGEVWACEAPGGLSKAVKITPLENPHDDNLCRELDGLAKISNIRHPYLLNIESWAKTNNNEFLVIVMELADMNLADRFDLCIQGGYDGIPRDELLRYMSESAEVLDLLNRGYQLQHLDVKPENLFLLSNHVKVADFGLVQTTHEGSAELAAVAITPQYAAPELFDGMVDRSADQYSLAVTYQELLTGHRPFAGKDVKTLLFQHLREQPDFSPLPPADRPIVAQATHREPEKRFRSCTEFVAALIRASDGAVTGSQTGSAQTGSGQISGVQAGGVVTGQVQRPESMRPPTPGGPESKRGQPLKPQRVGERTVPIPTSRARTVVLSKKGLAPEQVDRVRVAFVAFLPVEIYAHKLRGFIQELNAEVQQGTPDCTKIRFRRGNLLNPRDIYLQIDTFERTPKSGYRIVDATVSTLDPKLRGYQLSQRAMLIIRYLKAYLMAVDADPVWGLKSTEQLRSEVFE